MPTSTLISTPRGIFAAQPAKGQALGTLGTRCLGERAKRADMWSWMRFDVGGCRLDDGFLRM